MLYALTLSLVVEFARRGMKQKKLLVLKRFIEALKIAIFFFSTAISKVTRLKI